MVWWEIAIFIFSGLLILLASGLPIAFTFLLLDLVCTYIFWGGQGGLTQLVLSIEGSITSFTILPVPLFVAMGEVMFHSGMATDMMDVINKWLGKIPGRLSLIAILGGTIFAALTGSAMAGAAMLGSVLLPEMEKRGYKNPMTLGPIMAGGGLAIMIPPTALGVLMAAMARFSVGKFLIAIIVPGLLMSLCYSIYIIGRCTLQPSLAPSYKVEHEKLSTKLILTLRDVAPLGGIIFLVIGLLFLGVATPTEAAALGTAGTFVLAFIKKGFQWEMVKKSMTATLKVTVMILMILTGSTAFSQILAFTECSQGLTGLMIGFPLPPLAIVFMMQLLLFVMGCFMEPLSIMMVTVPIFFPIINKLGIDPMAFGVIFLINMEMATISPPFGLVLFVMKGIVPKHISMEDIYKAAWPFIAIHGLIIVFLMFFPNMIYWLPSLMGK